MLCDHRANMSWRRLVAAADFSAQRCASCNQLVRYSPLSMLFANGCLAIAVLIAVGWAGELRSYWPLMLVPTIYIVSRSVLVVRGAPRVQQPKRYSLLWFAILAGTAAAIVWVSRGRP
jgi:4-hydroxybenzoate polyprenyltransferase